MTQDDIDDWALHAYVDNELSPEQRAEVEALLARDPAVARKVDDWRRQRHLMKAAYDPVLSEHIPPQLAVPRRRLAGRSIQTYAAMAATLLLLLLGGLAGWFLNAQTDHGPRPDLAAEALAAHSLYAFDARHPVEVSADEGAHLQAWLAKRVGVPFKLPDLGAEGYTLLGGRVLPGQDSATAMLMYEASTGQRVSVLLTLSPAEQDTGLKIRFSGNLVVCDWQDSRLIVAVVGEMAREPMMKLARSIYEQLES